MTEQAMYDLLAALIFSAFVSMLIAISASMIVRAGRWIKADESPPVLLIREIIGFSGLSLSFLAIATARVIELPVQYLRTIPWLVFTSLPALIGLAVFLYFELFVIGHGNSKEGNGENRRRDD